MTDIISDYMRAMQLKSAAKRWKGITPEQRSAKMRSLRDKAKRAKKRKTSMPDKEVSVER